MDRIREASEVIQRRGGNFIPISETRSFCVPSNHCMKPLPVQDVLSVSEILSDDVAVADFSLRPLNRHWENGPYSKITQSGYWGRSVNVTGRWGKFDRTITLGLEDSQNETVEILTVENGSLLCPGMVVLVDEEQEFVTAGNGSKQCEPPTAVASLLAGAVDAQDSLLLVDNGSDFYVGEVIQIGVEDMKILKINENTLQVERGWNQTVSSDHEDDAVIKVYRTFTVVRGVNGSMPSAHMDATIFQCIAPEGVNYLCRQIAALMRMKAESGFSGVTGNAEGGQGRYYSEFPPNQIAEILDQYKIWRL
jgi:hypothetical protein